MASATMRIKIVAAMSATLLMLFPVGCQIFPQDDDEPEPPPNWVAQVTSGLSWSGYFGNRTVSGFGSQQVDLPDEEIVCVTVQKQTDSNGALTLQIKAINRGWNRDPVTTTAPYGVVTDCNQ